MVTLSTDIRWKAIMCCSVPLPGVQTNVSDSFSWTEFLRSAGKILHDWIPLFIRIFSSIHLKQFLLSMKSLSFGLSFQSSGVVLAFCVCLCSLLSTYQNYIQTKKKCIHLLYICRTCTPTVVCFVHFDIAPWKMKLWNIFAWLMLPSFCSFHFFVHTFVPVYTLVCDLVVRL